MNLLKKIYNFINKIFGRNISNEGVCFPVIDESKIELEQEEKEAKSEILLDNDFEDIDVLYDNDKNEAR